MVFKPALAPGGPKWVIIKQYTTAGGWMVILTTARRESLFKRYFTELPTTSGGVEYIGAAPVKQKSSMLL